MATRLEPPEVAAELRACFVPLLGALAPECAEVLRRVDLEGGRPVELAAEGGLTANNAMARLHRARRALRESLLLSCRTCADHGCLDCSRGRPRPESGRASGWDRRDDSAGGRPKLASRAAGGRAPGERRPPVERGDTDHDQSRSQRPSRSDPP